MKQEAPLIPEVGMPATMTAGSDSYPMKVIAVSKNKFKVTAQRIATKPGAGYDYYGNQVYEYFPEQVEGTPDTFYKCKDGTYGEQGNWLRLGYARKYEDPSF